VHNREGLLEHIAGNLTDLAIMVRPPADANVIALPFAPHPYVVVAAPTHPLAATRRIPRATLMREAFIVREKGSDTWKSMEEGFAASMAQLRVAMEIRSTETIKQAVMAGMGISFLSAHTVSRELGAGSLCVLDVEGLPLMLNWYVVHLRDKQLQPVTQAFKDFLLDDGAALIEQIVPFRPAA
jgi:DNA-binding transcriptional LysR family regulator